MKNFVSRRNVLSAAGLGTGALVLDGFVGLPTARADGACLPPDEAPLLIVCEFHSGWDILLSLDPRDHQKFNQGAVLQTAYDQSDDPLVLEMLANTGNTGLYQPPGCNVQYGPAMSKKLVDNHMGDLCVVRGVNMGTVTHEVGLRYFLTGKFPRGLFPAGSSLDTAWASHSGKLEDYKIPTMAAGGIETFNDGFPPTASSLKVEGYGDILQVLRPLNEALLLDPAIEKAAIAFHYGEHCEHDQYDAYGQVTSHRSAWSTAQELANGGLWKNFDFKPNPPVGSQLDKLYDAFGVAKNNPVGSLNGSKGKAALAAQAIVNRISQVVTMRLANMADPHSSAEWGRVHPENQRKGFDAISDLITYLKNTEDKNGKSFWDRTTLLAYSDFARTPYINSQGGRDHHLASACLVAGNGIKGNQAIGANKDTTFDARPVNAETGAPDDEMGVLIRPPEIHATMLEAAGLCHGHISNQEPKIIKAMLKKG